MLRIELWSPADTSIRFWLLNWYNNPKKKTNIFSWYRIHHFSITFTSLVTITWSIFWENRWYLANDRSYLVNGSKMGPRRQYRRHRTSNLSACTAPVTSLPFATAVLLYGGWDGGRTGVKKGHILVVFKRGKRASHLIIIVTTLLVQPKILRF